VTTPAPTTRAVYLKGLRVRRALAGLCLDCREDAAPERSRCVRCLGKHRRWARRYYRARVRAWKATR
jgi:uncharacterized OB-fold protein